MGDHLVHPRPLLESVVTLTTVAASTDRVAVGFCVLLVALRATVVLAKELATLAVFAPGRLRVGIGVGGEYPDEFTIAGVRLDDRGGRTEAAVRQLRSLVAGRPTTVMGVNGDEVEVTLAPPAPREVPFVFGGRNGASLRRAARLGDGWIGYLLGPESFARRRSLLLEHRAEHAGWSTPFTTGMLLPVSPDSAANGAQARAARAWATITANEATFPEHLFVAGPVDAIVEQLGAYWEQGCTDFVLSLVDHGPASMGQVEMLAAEVLPRVRAFR